mmetsp:Transcript_1831/g.4635  ORF Transcript_1831/g.4635 Transcript_1831/m.4635 type:complete len:205 (+) Transcript_1831:447-1061(+)
MRAACRTQISGSSSKAATSDAASQPTWISARPKAATPRISASTLPSSLAMACVAASAAELCRARARRSFEGAPCRSVSTTKASTAARRTDFESASSLRSFSTSRKTDCAALPKLTMVKQATYRTSASGSDSNLPMSLTTAGSPPSMGSAAAPPQAAIASRAAALCSARSSSNSSRSLLSSRALTLGALRTALSDIGMGSCEPRG